MEASTKDADNEVEALATIKKLIDQILIAEKLEISEDQIKESQAALERLKAKVDQVSSNQCKTA